MRIARYYEIIRKMSCKTLFSQIAFSFLQKLRYILYNIHDGCFSTQINCGKVSISKQESWTAGASKRKKDRLCPLPINFSQLDFSEFHHEKVTELIRMYLEHRFDLLGSGWVKNGYYNNAPGWEGHRYEALTIADFNEDWLKHILRKQDIERAQILGQMISKEYVPIDWQKDSKTGYRWDVRRWYRPLELGRLPGSDIKMPWELSRLEHLPRIAIFAYLEPLMRKRLTQEFVDECLDFMRQNPVRRGVNWMCTMDVGIRTANLVLAYSFFRAIDKDIFSGSFECLLTEIIKVHCKHIYHNLEWSAQLRSNHYLANICGLLYGLAVLPQDCRTKRWLGFARIAYEKELLSQFHEEGSNFEGSVGYHRLSGEMAAFTGAVIEWLSQAGRSKELSEQEWNRIINIGKFAQDTMNPDKCFVQIGDNDSGRFFTLSLRGNLKRAEDVVRQYQSLDTYGYEPDEWYWDEQVNSPEQLIGAVQGFAERVTGKVASPFEYSLIRSIVYSGKRNKKKGVHAGRNKIRTESHCQIPDYGQRIIGRELSYRNKWAVRTDGYNYFTTEMQNKNHEGNEVDLTKGLRYIEYPSFGVYIFQSDSLYLCVNGTDNGQNGQGGHGHNDKLSFELWINKKPVFQDPGTYVYTPLISVRNQYRSTRAHNCIQNEPEQNRFTHAFGMSADTKCRLLERSERGIVLQVDFAEVRQRRSIRIYQNSIEVTDESSHPFLERAEPVKITGGYGKLLRYIEEKR